MVQFENIDQFSFYEEWKQFRWIFVLNRTMNTPVAHYTAWMELMDQLQSVLCRPPPGFTNPRRPSLNFQLTPLSQPQTCLTDVESHGTLRLCLEVWREEE